ncbi:MAG: DNA-directed RNA polymerase subunit delta [Mycoplasma sp.]
MSRLLIDVAYDVAKQNYKNKQFAFNDLWSDVAKKVRYTPSQIKEETGEFYSDLMQDPRFIFCGKNNWQLSEYLTNQEKDKMVEMLYDLKSDVYEEGFEDEKDRNMELGDDEEALSADEERMEINEDNATEYETQDEEDDVYNKFSSMLKPKDINEDDEEDI